MGKPFTAEAYSYLTLRDGRRLGYIECGNPAGRPLFYFHALRLYKFGRLPHQIARRLGIRLIAPDRPGFGLSDFQPGRTLLDWAADVGELANALHISQFAVAGHSGGSPYAAVCAHQLLGRVTKAAMFSAIGWYEVPPKIRASAGTLPLSYHFNRIAAVWAARVYLRFSRRLGSTMLALAMAGRPGTVWVSAPFGVTQYMSDFGDSTWRDRHFGAAWELILLSRPWGFHLEDIKPEVHVWHGEADRLIPASLIRAMAGLIPNCRARILPGEDHFSMVPNYLVEMLKSVVS